MSTLRCLLPPHATVGTRRNPCPVAHACPSRGEGAFQPDLGELSAIQERRGPTRGGGASWAGRRAALFFQARRMRQGGRLGRPKICLTLILTRLERKS